MIKPEIQVEVVRRNDDVFACLKRLVGGSLAAGVISIDQTSDPDEDSELSSERIPGPKDKIDILSAYINMDPIEIGILTKQVSIHRLYETDQEAVKQDICRENR